MKKIVIAAIVISTGMALSCRKNEVVKPTAIVIEHNTAPYIKDIGTAD
ncbi:hypothetical protein [Mucilaginibacter pedocola]|nr:hypothetical protein [Mucilaginibacter pedocola]